MDLFSRVSWSRRGSIFAGAVVGSPDLHALCYSLFGLFAVGGGQEVYHGGNLVLSVRPRESSVAVDDLLVRESEENLRSCGRRRLGGWLCVIETPIREGFIDGGPPAT